jgi:serine/threonine protein kinase/formylglycine-generating enzyme required for sulfatase activity
MESRRRARDPATAEEGRGAAAPLHAQTDLTPVGSDPPRPPDAQALAATDLTPLHADDATPSGFATDVGGASSGSRPPRSGGDGSSGLGVSTDIGSATLRAPTPRPGAAGGLGRIGLYEIEGELGRGGMGTVYRAWHSAARQRVALKVIKPGMEESSKFERVRDLFLREGGILMSVDHPNVVRCIDVNEALHDGKPVLYMALEYLDGQSLASRLRAGPMPPQEAVRVARELALALHALHTNAQRVLHRDVTPGNIFVTSDGRVKLLDFGLASVADWRLNEVSMFAAGSRPYMSPEQFEGLRHCTERSDLYSLGVTLFHMIAGRTPFDASTDQGYLRAHKETSPPTLREANPALAPDKLLEAAQNVVTRLLAKRPEERYASAQAVADELRRVEGGSVITAPKVTRPEAVRLRRRVLAGVLLLLLLGGAGAGGILAWRSTIPAQLERAVALNRALDLDGAAEAVRGVLEKDADHVAAKELLAEIGRRTAARDAAREVRSRAEKARRSGDRRAAARASGEALEALSRSGVVPAAEVDAAREEARRAEAERASAFEAAASAAASALARDDLEAGAASLAEADALAAAAGEAARLEEVRAEAGKARARVAQREEIAAARAELERGELAAARRRLDALGENLAASLAASHEEALRDARRAEEARGALEGLEAALGGPRVAEALAPARPLADAVAADAALARRSGFAAERARELLARAEREVALAAVRAAEAKGDPAALEAAIAAARASLAPGDRAEAARLEEVGDRARRALFDAAADRAERLLGEGRAAEAERSARDALARLSGAERAILADLARAVVAARADAAAAREAREEFWRRVRAESQARPGGRLERGWLLLEGAAAALEARPEERLVRRADGVILGSENRECRNPLHQASVPPFFIDATEVDAASYARYLEGAPDAAPPSGWESRRAPAGRDTQPVRGVGFAEAKAYAASLGKRLPSAEEWEVAASLEPVRARGRRRFPWGDEWLASIARRGGTEPRSVGTTLEDTSPWGCLDMGGNVAEWTSLREGGAEVAALKGGSFLDARHPSAFHPANLVFPEADYREEDAGLRCARDVPVPSLAEFAKE